MLRFADQNFVVQPNIIMWKLYHSLGNLVMACIFFFLYWFLKRGISTNFAAVDFAFDRLALINCYFRV